MKLPTATAALPLLLSFAAIAAAQTAPAPPPIKMGLWHEEVTTVISGIDGVTPTPHKDVEQSCISPESWKHGLQANSHGVQNCTMSNLHQDAHHVSYDESCGSQPNGLLVFHMEILIDDNQHMHGTAVAKVSVPGSSKQATWNSTLTERYLSPDCGTIQPGEKKSLNQ
jgi:hypothetical protein